MADVDAWLGEVGAGSVCAAAWNEPNTATAQAKYSRAWVIEIYCDATIWVPDYGRRPNPEVSLHTLSH